MFAQNLLAAASYWLSAALVQWYFAQYQMWPAPIWPPAGIALYVALAMGRWSWPGIFLGAMLTDTVSFGEPAARAAVLSLGNTLAPMLAAELVRARIRKQEPFARVIEALFFGLCAFVDGMIAAMVGATTIWTQTSAPLRALPTRWFEWTLSDAGGCLLLAPLFLLARSERSLLQPIRERPREFGISAALSVLTVVYLLFGRYGPFFGVEKGGVLAIFAQMAVGFGASVLLLGGAANEQLAAKQALRKLNLDLEERVEERTAQLRESQNQLEKAAFYDPLTGLPNRRRLQERFGSCGVAARRKGDRFALLLLDLDHFKDINDRLGHDAGDAVLVETACRLTTAVRDGDVVARMGGDEFAILLTETRERGDIDRVCKRIVGKLRDPIHFHDSTLNTSASIGVALSPDHGATWQAVYKAAGHGPVRSQARGPRDLALASTRNVPRRWRNPDLSRPPRAWLSSFPLRRR